MRLELALRQFAEIHRSGQSKALVRRVKSILSMARERLLGTVNNSGIRTQENTFSDTQPAGSQQI